MEFSKVQKRFINQKSVGYQIVKGKKGTGKSTSAIYRAINLENNYCIYEEDKILIVTSNYSKTRNALELYDEESNRDYFYSLFSLDKNRVNISTLEKLISTYSAAYKREKKISLSNIDEKNQYIIFEKLNDKIEEFSKKSKLIKNSTKDFLLDEVLWIKSSAFTLEEYMEVERKGRTGRVLKNSTTREFLFKLMELYNEELKVNGYMDKYDHITFAGFYIKNNNINYTHIIIDDCEKLTKGEIGFLKDIYSGKSHSSLIFIVNSELHSEKYSWLVKGRKLKTLGADFKGRTFSYKTSFEATNKKSIINTISNYKYINIKNKNIFDFNIDTASTEKEIFLNEGISFKEKELIDVPVFNDIAAGNPIEINENIEGVFNIPKMWLEKGKESFILKVKGDSMVDKNICNGDLVVIKKQNTANHNDIVAANLDGEATLKTLNMNSEVPMLMPANELYTPIPLINKEVSILGVAIGVIKNQ
ncbi:transcriptional repressor LexA [Clostridium sp.]|uniref:transcriptional repressor LexA n=1 Tax=Clostridium sp. TaxID=1506 RepID=UPI003F3B7AA7